MYIFYLPFVECPQRCFLFYFIFFKGIFLKDYHYHSHRIKFTPHFKDNLAILDLEIYLTITMQNLMEGISKIGLKMIMQED